ncbi:hypothetical protein [Desmospora profundinema]|uniref:Uncharacterized protein n=1 Tax=Desmospora profundinema TaxID=1571184 RepID=A0ABU1IRE4_9BACL|nr:hypothetical protein [Desmospora profundinema]MDR6227371.1 hypothetical protein [Desmospora profundinema]
MGHEPRQRPWGWWKSGNTLFWIWLGGSLAICLTALAFLYPAHLNLKHMEEKRAEAERFLSDHREILDPGYERPTEPDADERTRLQQQIPLEAEPARLLLQLKEAVDDAGGEWVELRAGSKSSDLTPMEWPVEVMQEADRDEETGEEGADDEKEAEEKIKPAPSEGKKPEENAEEQALVPTLPKDSAIQPLWADLYVRASRQEMLSLLRELEQMERLVAVQGMEFEEGEGERGTLRIRLAWFYYQDPSLKESMESPPLRLPEDVDIDLDEDGREIPPSPESDSGEESRDSSS